MIGWSQFLSPEEAETIRAYVGAQARVLQQAEARERARGSAGIEPPITNRHSERSATNSAVTHRTVRTPHTSLF